MLSSNRLNLKLSNFTPQESIPSTITPMLQCDSDVLPSFNGDPELCLTPERTFSKSKTVRFNSFIATDEDKENNNNTTDAELSLDPLESRIADSELKVARVNSSQRLFKKLDDLRLSRNDEQVQEAVRQKLAKSSKLRTSISDTSTNKLNEDISRHKYANLVALDVNNERVIQQRELLISDHKAKPRNVVKNENENKLEDFYKDYDFEPEFLSLEQTMVEDNRIGLNSVPTHKAFDFVVHQRLWNATV